MLIGIEAQRIFRRRKHGMDYVVLEEIRRLQKKNLHDHFYIFVAPGEDRCLEDSSNVHIIEVNCPTYPLWEQVALPIAVRKYHLDILHCTSNTAPVFCPVPLILTLHDIIFLEERESANKSLYQNLGWYYRRLVVPRILGKCKAIVTVSDYEMGNIRRRLPSVSDRLHRIYNGYNEWFRPVPAGENSYDRYDSLGQYFFFLGNTDPKKNTRRTLSAYARYLRKSTVKRKLLIGDLGERDLACFLRENGDEDIRPYIQLTGYIDNSKLPFIYNKAFAFLYTSLRESFGIPLLEALACACPVITSNTSSLPEISRGAAIEVDPASAECICAAMLELENDKELVHTCKTKGLLRARDFSWDRTADELLNLYRKI